MTFKEVLSSIDFSFLTSNRFWALFLGAIIVYLNSKGYIGQAETTLVATIAYGFIGIRTIDRIGDKFSVPENLLPPTK